MATRIINQPSLVIFENSIRVLIGLIITFFFARQLGASDWGLLSYSIFIAGLGTHIGMMGIDQKIISVMYNNEDDAERSLLSASIIIFAFTLAISIVFGVLAFTLNFFSDIRMYVFLLLCFSSFQFGQLFDHYFYYKSRPLTVFSNKILYNILNGLIKFFCIYYETDFIIIVLAFAVENLLYALLVFSNVKVRNVKITYQILLEYFTQLIRPSLILLIGSTLAFIAYRIDLLLLKSLTSLIQVGVYSVFIKIISSWILVTSALSNYLVPYINQVIREKHERALLSILILVFITCFVFILVSYLAVPVLVSQLSQDFALVSELLLISYIAVPLIFLNSIFNRFLLLLELDKFIFLKSVLLLPMATLSGYFLISNLQLMGAVINFVLFFVNSTVINFLTWYFLIKERDFSRVRKG